MNSQISAISSPCRVTDCAERVAKCSDAFLAHCDSRRGEGRFGAITVATYRRVLDAFWRPKIGCVALLDMRYSTLVRIADEPAWSKKTYNNTVSILRRAFRFGHRDPSGAHDPTVGLRSVRIRKREPPPSLTRSPFRMRRRSSPRSIRTGARHRATTTSFGSSPIAPSEQIALLVSDFDPTHGTLGVNKACVVGIDKDSTKTGEDRRIELCPARAPGLNRQLALRDALAREGKISHGQLFFKATGEPIRNRQYAHSRWRPNACSFTRYSLPQAVLRPPLLGQFEPDERRRPLWVAKQHGHSITTMLNVYAAWTDEANEADLDPSSAPSRVRRATSSNGRQRRPARPSIRPP